MDDVFNNYLNVGINLVEVRKKEAGRAFATSEDLVGVADRIAMIFPEVDQATKVRIQRHLENIVAVVAEVYDMISDQADHQNWDEKIASIDFRFWDRYQTYLHREKHWSDRVVHRLGVSTKTILSLLEDPNRPGPWSVKGLVVGHVQSGKTASYIGLLNRAADAGYPLVVILAGTDNNLRSQTQLRVDSDFLGFNTIVGIDDSGRVINNHIGVGTMHDFEFFTANTFTSSADHGDFKGAVAGAAFAQIGAGQPPAVAVIKKNATVMTNLRKWLSQYAQPGTDTISAFPILVIDDEADSAGVNSKDADVEPARINKEIRMLLKMFTRSSYVGYTATPFANVFIDKNDSNEEFGPDLFPTRFILGLKAPSNYFGPARLFGLNQGEELPLFREVDDSDDWISPRHKVTENVGEVPESLRIALMSFVLSRAVRIFRGDANEHNSMLIHVTRFNDVQAQVRSQVDDELIAIQAGIAFGNPDVMALLERIWNEDYVVTSKAFQEAGSEYEIPTFEQIRALLSEAMEDIVVKSIDGRAQDVLEYRQREKVGRRLNVIAIGGNKLSRGLTLDGLTVSYYLRSAGAYDTLLQMGRWFGYRDNYEDVCRLYTSAELWERYRRVSVAGQELFEDIEEMAAQGLTPLQFGLKVKNSVPGMTISRPAVLRHAKRLTIGFAGSIAVTSSLIARSEIASKNEATLSKFIERLQADVSEGKATFESRPNHFVWSGVSGATVAGSFFEQYETVPEATKANSKIIADYIKQRIAHDELIDWTVGIASPKGLNDKVALGGLNIGLTTRNLAKKSVRGQTDASVSLEILRTRGIYTVKTVLNPEDEYLDFNAEEVAVLKDQLLQEREIEGRVPGSFVRSKRSPQKGLLLIYALRSPADVVKEMGIGVESFGKLFDGPLVGFAVSFPGSRDNSAREYVVGQVYLEQLKNEVLAGFSDEEDDGSEDGELE